MGTIELGNGEQCPFNGCNFILGEDYDGDSFEHIMKDHGDEAMKELFPPKKIDLSTATNIMAMIIEYAQFEDDKLILRKAAIEPIKEVYQFLLQLNNKGENNDR